jgi:hypothetical protein
MDWRPAPGHALGHVSDLAPLLGVAAALIGLADMAPYVRDTLRRSTRPHRGTWLIWTVLAVVVSLSQHAAADLIAVAMMVPKTWRDPGSETLSTFAWASLAGALSAAAVGAPEPSLLLYPLYYCLGNGGLALLIGVRSVVVVEGAPR